jgi:arabinofuranosyltransferase
MQSKTASSRLTTSLSPSWRSRITSYVLLVVSLVVFAKNFWLDEDAYIPFRSLAQLQAGNGAVWNIGARVQVYTSVAWYWLQAAVNMLLHNVILTTIIVTALLFVTLLTLARRIYGDTPALWFLLLSFLLSKAFFDYTSGGFDNILAYNVLLVLYAAYRQTGAAQTNPASPWQLCLIASLTGFVPLVRYDFLLLCLLPFALLLWRERHNWRLEVTMIALAGMPLLVWTIASLVYYGLPLPNTAYAKLYHGFPAGFILKTGLTYLYWNGRADPLTMLIIAAAPVLAFLKLRSWQRAFALGVMLYCLYLCRIGGDYHAGRFLSFPFLVAALLVADWLQSLTVRRVAAWTALATAGAYLWLVPATPLLTPWTYGRDLDTFEKVSPIAEKARFTGAMDARAMGYSTTLAAWWRNEQRAPCGVEFSRRMGEGLHTSSDKVVNQGPAGVSCYYAGLNIHVVDFCALTDPFLSHLPSTYCYAHGHFFRFPVEGYLDHLRDGITPIRDPQLNRYCQQIELITRSPDLFSLRRLRTIVAFNLGRYDSLLDDYRHQVASGVSNQVFWVEWSRTHTNAPAVGGLIRLRWN